MRIRLVEENGVLGIIDEDNITVIPESHGGGVEVVDWTRDFDPDSNMVSINDVNTMLENFDKFDKEPLPSYAKCGNCKWFNNLGKHWGECKNSSVKSSDKTQPLIQTHRVNICDNWKINGVVCSSCKNDIATKRTAFKDNDYCEHCFNYLRDNSLTEPKLLSYILEHGANCYHCFVSLKWASEIKVTVIGGKSVTVCNNCPPF